MNCWLLHRNQNNSYQKSNALPLLVVFFCLTHLHYVNGFVNRSILYTRRISYLVPNVLSRLHAKSKLKRKQGGSSGSVSGLKGFGGGSKTSKKGDPGVDIDRSRDALDFYDYMERNGAGDNLKRTGLGYFSLPGGGKIRGIVALKDLKKGDVVIRIPYEAAINLGQEGGDPTKPAVELLSKYCASMIEKNKVDTKAKTPYYRMLPGYMSEDCLGSTDFYSDKALETLQSPLIVEETMKRRERTKAMFEKESNFLPSWIDGIPITEKHLRWAVWLITSRILTVEGAAEEKISYRMLIPFLVRHH